MRNKAMERKLQEGELIDVSQWPTPIVGVYALPGFIDGKDYADIKSEEWIWSIGRELETGRIFASTDTRFYDDNNFECLFLR